MLKTKDMLTYLLALSIAITVVITGQGNQARELTASHEHGTATSQDTAQQHNSVLSGRNPQRSVAP